MRDSLDRPDRYEALSAQLSTLAAAYITPQAETPFDGMTLTPTERRILGVLWGRMGKICSRSQIHDALYFDKPDATGGDEVITVKVCALRKILSQSKFFIETVHSQGYKLVEKPAP